MTHRVFAGLSLLLTPFLLGEITVRAAVHRARGGVPIATTVVINLWERFLDLVALGLMTGTLAIVLGRSNPWTLGLLAGAALTLSAPVRRLCLQAAMVVARPTADLFDGDRTPDVGRLMESKAWAAALAASVAAWILPGIGFWRVVGVWGHPFDVISAEYAYAASASLGGLVLAPGGVLVAGGRLLTELEATGFPTVWAALSVFGVRLATLGVATMLGGVFLLIHLRTRASGGAAHFDTIADTYDAQVPESRREALLTRKTELMREVLERLGIGPRGLDAGCGQGAYVARMRQFGFDVTGIDASDGQVELAAQHVASAVLVTAGSVLHIPVPDASYDFAYTINTLHHLASVDEQRRAFGELMRVLRPGGVLFVHEINTRNILFRFYMGYVFPSLNCIDEGVERWLLPNRMPVYTDARVMALRYFTFLPDFAPRPVVRLLTPLECLLEASPLRVYSAHYMAVVQKEP